MFYFKRNIMYPDKRTDETGKVIDRSFKEYEEHIRSIRDSLPETARSLLGISFHDAHIKAVTHISKKVIEVTLEGGGYDIIQKTNLKYGEYTLSFSGVKKAWIPYKVIGDVWLYEEMHLSNIAAFHYQALLYKDEISIEADRVLMDIKHKSWNEV